MNELVLAKNATGDFSMGGLRVHRVDGDGMAPDLRENKDYVLVKPMTDFCHEGVYLIFDGFGPALYRVTGSGKKDKPIRLTLDNPLYRHYETGGYCWTRDEFKEVVLGIVVADVHVRESELLSQMS